MQTLPKCPTNPLPNGRVLTDKHRCVSRRRCRGLARLRSRGDDRDLQICLIDANSLQMEPPGRFYLNVCKLTRQVESEHIEAIANLVLVPNFAICTRIITASRRTKSGFDGCLLIGPAQAEWQHPIESCVERNEFQTIINEAERDTTC